jgi:hypothetical protein
MHASTKLITLFLFPALSLAADSTVRNSGRRMIAFPPVSYTQPEYVFDGAVAIEARFDHNDDGKPERCEYYRNEKLVKVQVDRDSDGEIDWREQHADTKAWFDVREIKGKLKFVPMSIFPALGSRMFQYRFAVVQKLIEGKWTGTFEDVQSQYGGQGPADGPIVLTLRTRFVDGKIVQAVFEGSHNWRYQKVLFNNGKIVETRYGTREEDIRQVTSCKDGRPWRQEEDRDRDGRMDFRRYCHPEFPHLYRFEKLDGDKWTGDFEDSPPVFSVNGSNRKSLAKYEDGYPVFSEIRNVDTGAIIERTLYENGFKVSHEWDSDGDEAVDMRYCFSKQDPYTITQTLRLVDGKWTGDFVLEKDNATVVYRQGKTVRKEWGFDEDEDGRPDLLWISVSDKEIHTGRHGRIDTWQYFNDERQLVLEKRDLDGDGIADVTIDHEHLTIEEVKENTK